MKKNTLLITLFIILAVDAMNFGLVIPVLSKLFLGDTAIFMPAQASLVSRYSMMGVVLGIYPLAVVVGTPLLGVLSDRYGRKPILLLALCGAFGGLFFSGIAIKMKSIILFLLTRGLIGICAASQPIAQASVADMSTEKNRPIYFSLVAFAMTIGMLAGPLLGGFLSDAALCQFFSVSLPFFVASGLAFLNVVFMIIAYRETLPVGLNHTLHFKKYAKTCLLYFKHKRFLQLLFIFCFLELAWSLFFQTEPMRLAQEYHYNSEMQSLYVTFLGIVMCFGLSVLFKPLHRKITLQKIILFCLVINTLAYAAFFLFAYQLTVWILTIPFTLGIGLCYTAVMSELSFCVSAAEQGWLMSFMGALLALSWAITGFLGPKLLATSLFLPIIGCVGISFIAWMMCLRDYHTEIFAKLHPWIYAVVKWIGIFLLKSAMILSSSFGSWLSNQ